MHYDLIIMGGAMTGSTLALALSARSQGRIRIAVLEKQVPHQHLNSGFDARTIALSHGSCRQFDTIRLPGGQTLWQQLQPFATPIKRIHVSDKGHSGIVEFNADEFQLAQLGAVIELSRAGDVLLNAMVQYPNIDYLAPADIDRIARSQTGVEISLKNDRTLSAQLLVGADGTQSTAASAAGIQMDLLHAYGQTAIISNIQVQQPHNQRAFERFTDEGPIALLPMRDNLMSLVWCVKRPQPLLRLDDQAFLAALQRRFGWRLGKLQQCGQRAAYPLNLYRASQHIQSRIALIGNAAQTLHPIAGQGFNLAIRDVMSLAEILARQYSAQQDIGDYHGLQQYQQNRIADQRQMMRLTDGLLSVFANQLLPLQIGRNLGLMALSQSALLRRHFAKPALGWR
ncbi:2-octaprenyl-6-methoxyphenyl hydroxylase [Necropsobacter rosorum]|uniref:2-octaprenyl-6-methoxyphenyl hydroxylase n=1 Tax=Necropsobacter rosorum TaxID=908285 RepID=UPI000509BA6B